MCSHEVTVRVSEREVRDAVRRLHAGSVQVISSHIVHPPKPPTPPPLTIQKGNFHSFDWFWYRFAYQTHGQRPEPKK